MKHILAIILLALPIALAAERKIDVANFYYDPHDLTAINERTKILDDNSEVCALIKIETTQKGFSFEGGTVGIVKVDDNHTGEIWVYIPAKLRRITIMHEQLGVLRNYEFPVTIESARTYIMELITGTVQPVVVEQASTQWLVLNFTPKDAMVEVDDAMVNCSNGLYKATLPIGSHTVRVSAKNYHNEVARIVLDEKGTCTKSIDLKPAFGWVEVTGPNGATVYIDNEKIGTAPVKSHPLASGRHDLRISKDKWQPYRETVIVNDNLTTTVTPSLVANFVTVTLKTDNNAEIWVDNVMQGSGSVTIDLSPKEYTIETRKAGHRSQSVARTITMASSGTIDLPAPVAIVGSLSIDVTPVGASIYVDESYVGKSPLMLNNVLIGSHQVRSEYSGLGSEIRSVTISEGKTSEVVIEMKRSAKELYDKGVSHYDAKDYVKAVEYYRQAAEMGYADAQCDLGYCYRYGLGVEQNSSTAVEWYRKAANQGQVTAQCNLGNCYYEGNGVTKDYTIAVEWYRKAANQGDADAQCNLGECYYYGHGVEQNYYSAVEWFRKAANQGDVDAQNWMGSCYYKGYGVTKDYNIAVEWFRKAANQGRATAQFNLGLCYEYGKGVNKNITTAVKWYRKAAAQGDEDAKKKLAKLGY